MLFTDFSRGCYFDGMIYAETILAEAQERKRMDYTPELNYQAIVKKIGTWIEGWLAFTMPRPSELMYLYTDAFLMVMKAQRKPLTMENYYEFMEGLRNDVIRYMAKQHEKYSIGFKTNITKTTKGKR